MDPGLTIQPDLNPGLLYNDPPDGDVYARLTDLNSPPELPEWPAPISPPLAPVGGSASALVGQAAPTTSDVGFRHRFLINGSETKSVVASGDSYVAAAASGTLRGAMAILDGAGAAPTLALGSPSFLVELPENVWMPATSLDDQMPAFSVEGGLPTSLTYQPLGGVLGQIAADLFASPDATPAGVDIIDQLLSPRTPGVAEAHSRIGILASQIVNAIHSEARFDTESEPTALVDWVASLVQDQGNAPVTAIVDSSQRLIRQMESGELHSGMAPTIARQAFVGPQPDATLGVIAAYLYLDGGEWDLITRIGHAFCSLGGQIPFDVAMLIGGPYEELPTGAMKITVPAVEAAADAILRPLESAFPYETVAAPEVTGIVAGVCPWFRRGWQLLDPSSGLVREEVMKARKHLLGSFITSLDPKGAKLLAKLI